MAVSLNCFVLADSSKCVGFKACEVACSVAHTDQGVTTAGTMSTPIIPRLYLVQTSQLRMPVQCRHCEDAPCANVCPVDAITENNGTIKINENICIGCKTCMMACPFGAIEIVPRYVQGEELKQNLEIKTAKGAVQKSFLVANKCDLCMEQESGPACVQACPKDALQLMSPNKIKQMKNEEAALKMLNSVKKFMS